MADGADNSGDDMVVGRTNQSEERTILVAQNGDNAPGGYAADFVLSVSTAGDQVLPTNSHGVDAVHAKGTIAFPTGGMIGTIPAANGVVGQGLNGIVGYVHPATRDKGAEQDSHAGVLGMGAPNDAGVLGRGLNGVVGYEQGTARDVTFEASETAGVLGRGPIGVSGDGVNGPGVHGRGGPGVLGDGVNGLPGVSGDGGGAGGIGVLGLGHDGEGIHGRSDGDRGGIFQSLLSRDGKRIRAQISLVPLSARDPANPSRMISDPSQLTKADAGDLCVTIEQDVRTNMRPIAALWFCTETSGPTGTPVWVRIA